MPIPGFRRPVSLTLLLALAALCIWSILRLVLLSQLETGALGLYAGLIALRQGLWFDAATLAYLMPPFFLASALLPAAWRGRSWVDGLGWGLLWLALVLLLFAALAEITFWREFDTRFNFIAVDYLIYTQEVIGNILESYPVVPLLGLVVALATGMTWLAHRNLRWRDTPPGRAGRLARVALALLLPMASLHWASIEQMAVTGNAYGDELAGNGLFTLAAAMGRNELDYDRFYAKLPPARMEAIMTSLDPADPPRLGPTGQEALPAPFKRRPKNVVLISVESLSARYVGAYDGQEGLTPNLDRLAAQGLRFERIFATGTRTVRGLESLSIAVPPLPGQSIVRRPHNGGLATLGQILGQQGFSSSFIYGGYGYFDNMNAYFGGNGYQVADRTDFPADSVVFANIWGVADESLYANASRQFDRLAREGKPFFAHIMTTSNHRPYTYPQGRIDIPSPGGRQGAVKYTDYAIGRFIETARRQLWFADTLFIITADHCASVAGKTKLPVAKYHIPLIFYAPALLQPGSHDRLASQIDIAPTVLHVLGLSGKGRFAGHSLLAPARAELQRAFISNYQQLGYYKDDMLTILLPRRRIETYHIDTHSLEATPVEADPRLVQEAIAYYQSTARDFRQGRLRSQDLQRLAQGPGA